MAIDNKSDIEGFFHNASTFQKGELWYIASPYSHPQEIIQNNRINEIRQVVAGIIKKHSKEYVYPLSPIIYSCDVEQVKINGDVCAPHIGWYLYDIILLNRCDKLKVVKLDGYENSTGIKFEIAYALGKGIPVGFIDIEDYLLK